jgi:hypothetical protein
MSHLISNYEPSAELLKDERHSLALRVDLSNSDVYLECSSRLALREFALSLLDLAANGGGSDEFYPLGVEKSWLVVNGARLIEGSSRLFLTYPQTTEPS